MYVHKTFICSQNPQNVKILKINDINRKKNRKFMNFFKVFDEKKSELTCESFFISPVCGYDFMNHNEHISRHQKYFDREIFHEK